MRVFAVVAACVLLAACQAKIRADVVVDADGAGNVAVVVELDEAMMGAVDEMAFDPTVELAAIAAAVEPWEVSRAVSDGTLRVELNRSTTTMKDVGDAFRELAEGLADVDPGLIIDVVMRPDGDGAIVVSGSAHVRPPASVGWQLDGVEQGPSAAELQQVVDRHVDARFRLHLRGDVVEANADEIDAGTLTWQIPVGTARELSATVAPMASRRTVILSSAATVAVALMFTGVALFRRERRSASTAQAPARHP
ncbi:MAG: hypothetical protein WD576_02630 [Nitriliruptoraceae bacterium]